MDNEQTSLDDVVLNALQESENGLSPDSLEDEIQTEVQCSVSRLKENGRVRTVQTTSGPILRLIRATETPEMGAEWNGPSGVPEWIGAWLVRKFEPETVSVLFGLAALSFLIYAIVGLIWFIGSMAGWW